MINFNDELTYFKEKLYKAFKIEISETIILKPKFINCNNPIDNNKNTDPVIENLSQLATYKNLKG